MTSNRVNQIAKDVIISIRAYRKANKGKYVSTSHIFTEPQFLLLAKHLKKAFKKFKAEFEDDKVTITIS